jgi:tyrosinase
MPFSRRTFVRGAAAIPFAVWLEQQAWAQTVFVRYDATSANGQAMLKIYAGAVKKMMDTAQIKEGNPHSWVFQWYTHFVRGDRSKTSELARIYPNLTPPNNVWKALATEVWDTCQSHMGQDPNYFLPWHRMVVFYFEEIIRNVSGVPTFTLPYWNYTVNGPLHGVVPAEFRKPGDATFGSLYKKDRNPNANNGVSISKGFNPDPINLDSFKQCNYKRDGVIPGFCRDIDSNLHGQVHVKTGTPTNMGDVPYAAGDPVFWLHHCQIDRLWASWNAAGHKNPSDNAFLIKSFTFADGKGNKVTAKIGDVLDVAQLKYRYDSLETVPKCTEGVPTAAAIAPRRLVEKKSPIPLGPGPVREKLQAPPSTTASVPLGDRIAKLAPNKKLFLVVSSLEAKAQPGVTYNLYLELPAGTAPEPSHFVGSINFFDAAMGMTSDKFFSFDITDLAKRLKAQGKLATGAELMIAPEGAPSAAAKPVIGDVSIVEQ